MATSYGQLIEESLRFGHGLTNVAGLEKGDTLLLFSPNSVLYPILLFAGQVSLSLVWLPGDHFGGEGLR